VLGGGSGWGSELNDNLILRLESFDFDDELDLASISTWSDTSGGANHMTSQGAGYDPWVDQVETLNGHATVRMVSSTVPRHLRKTTNWNNDPGTWDAAEIMVIMKKRVDVPTSPGAPFKLGGGGTNDSHVPFTDNIVYENFCDAIRPASSNPTTPFNQWNGYNVRATKVLSTQVQRVQVLGSEVIENKASGGTWSNPTAGNALAIGITYQGNYTPPTYPHISMDGNVAAYYMWSRVLDATDRTAFAAYILSTWGVTIPTT
jgi:hypothetical protein